MPGGSVLHTLEYPATNIAFSPLGTFLLLWEPYAVARGETGKPNLHVWSMRDKEIIIEYYQKRLDNWLIQWSKDESVCARNVTNEVHFFEGCPGKSPGHRLVIDQLSSFSLSPSLPLHVSVHVKGSKGAPSVVRIYKYPVFTGSGSVIANKSFYKADTVQMKWDHEGKGVLVLTTTDVDKSGESYYGEQHLYYLTVKGDGSMVPLDKKGPVYSVEWSPTATEFCVIYGFMPSKAALFNSKCDLIFDFGITHRNTALYNKYGSLIFLAGFGNLRGNMEFWNNEKRTLIGKGQASDSTQCEWSHDGVHILTATTAPRLRVGNGFKVWKYNGDLIFEIGTKDREELWECSWLPANELIPPVIKEPSAAASKQLIDKPVAAYVPPSLRGKQPSRPVKKDIISEDTTKAEPLSKSAAKNKKKREAQKHKKDDKTTEQLEAIATASYITGRSQESSSTLNDNEKRIKALRKKLRQIDLLKEQVKEGKTLEANQLEKLKTESSIIEEIKELELK
ncbi:PREDICTED: eukaryotic translation initiation factor 2A-like isoform X2 [Amphimedon queenslandica]|nr:PREDICTED: eukaryotic translation initiation factor 2A-like isoform X2 [Amphimedon queenslandica]|eukprot:XP_019857196.1 PREDICTED: eukaryotic translation initiation factor 2A-like isoform X2 [Amphimedon queenslandica]